MAAVNRSLQIGTGCLFQHYISCHAPAWATQLETVGPLAALESTTSAPDEVVNLTEAPATTVAPSVEEVGVAATSHRYYW